MGDRPRNARDFRDASETPAVGVVEPLPGGVLLSTAGDGLPFAVLTVRLFSSDNVFEAELSEVGVGA